MHIVLTEHTENNSNSHAYEIKFKNKLDWNGRIQTQAFETDLAL